MQEIKNTTQTVRDLWADFFPHKNTPPADVARTVANKEYILASLLYYGWKPKNDKLDVNIMYIDGGIILYYERVTPCALITVDWSGPSPSLRFVYADNRPQ
jgi:hypothetical protein